MHSDYHILHNAINTIATAHSDNVASTKTISVPVFKVGYHFSDVKHFRNSSHRAAESESRPELESVGVDHFGMSRSWSR